MIVLNLKGGLGNQMFQYAAARSLALKHKQKLCFDLRFLQQNVETEGFTARTFSLDIFNFKIRHFQENNQPSFITRIIKRWIKKPEKQLQQLNDYSNLNDIDFPVYLDGYFQSEKYFHEHRSVLLKDFSFQLSSSDPNTQLLKDIKQNNAVSIHFRRGDYVNKTTVAQVHGTCSTAYYENAMALLAEKFSDLFFYIFSDEPEWVAQYFIPKHQSTYKMMLVNKNDGVNSWKDMFLMSSCKHNIIANSSFSWWGAWLNQYEEKIVIAPAKWYADSNVHEFEKDIVPPQWIKI